MPETLISYDFSKPPEEQDIKPHNRWHPDIPMAVRVKPGAEFRLQCFDWTGGQIENNDSANDIRDVDLTKVHYLSGPVGIEGAEPGDLLVVDILDAGPLPDQLWGFNGIFARENGGGFLVDHFPEARKSIWDFHGIYTSSRHIPKVRFPGIIHPGLIGTLPSKELLKQWNDREKALVDTDPNRVPPLATLPYEETALMGSMKGEEAKAAAREAARTVPPREHGGNCDIKNLSRGSRVYFPVYVKEAGLSMGDLHFSQGDGEITFCGAIEMAGFIELRVNLIKGGMKKYNISSPIFQPSKIDPQFKDYLIFEGISVDEDGKQHYLDAHIAYRRACLAAIDYLKNFGYSGEQAYAILGTAPVEGHISGIVDIPNVCATLWLPTEVFEFDIHPTDAGPAIEIPSGIDTSRTS
ncbi:formamidase [Thioalkalivibrio sulfidiphilus]|uniref:Formamidase n=1 Tax=Thioalkalivibrio sulfidiphilus (strain HL-EbGR7) TaxID=396588 RepID=B8GQ32_THISH|nr:formamidase [Thioalkalivibrio sulfidiphilus]ACL74179.1 Formamidase [Thioalkalivibrio sulfidiphilus HL-EbGr7]